MNRRWIAKHGNVRTRLTVVDASDEARIKLRVTDPCGSTSRHRGQIVTYDLDTLHRYYEPVAASSKRLPALWTLGPRPEEDRESAE